MMRRGCSAVVISLTALSLSVAYATDYTWNGGASGEWTTPSNWLPDTGYPNDAIDIPIQLTGDYNNNHSLDVYIKQRRNVQR